MQTGVSIGIGYRYQVSGIGDFFRFWYRVSGIRYQILKYLVSVSVSDLKILVSIGIRYLNRYLDFCTANRFIGGNF
jgi:hypothetical protein